MLVIQLSFNKLFGRYRQCKMPNYSLYISSLCCESQAF